jgi:hypothetical protein
MFFVEASVFFIFAGGFFAWLLVSERFLAWRYQKESERLQAFASALQGSEISEVLERFGPPREHFEGSSGKSLYVWQRPPSGGLPSVQGLLVLTITVDQKGRIEESVWERR